MCIFSPWICLIALSTLIGKLFHSHLTWSCIVFVLSGTQQCTSFAQLIIANTAFSCSHSGAGTTRPYWPGPALLWLKPSPFQKCCLPDILICHGLGRKVAEGKGRISTSEVLTQLDIHFENYMEWIVQEGHNISRTKYNKCLYGLFWTKSKDSGGEWNTDRNFYSFHLEDSLFSIEHSFSKARRV